MYRSDIFMFTNICHGHNDNHHEVMKSALSFVNFPRRTLRFRHSSGWHATSRPAIYNIKGQNCKPFI